MQLLGPTSDPVTVAEFGGGKVAGLHRLGRAGFPVPDWLAIGTDVFAAFVIDAGLDAMIAEYVAARDEPAALATGAAVRAAIGRAELPEPVRASVADAWRTLGGPIAVRSSAAAEDGARYSYAGLFDSFLGVRGPDEAGDRVRDCWASAFGDRTIRYAFAHGLDRDPAIAVVLQRMVHARVAGVAFTGERTADGPVLGAVPGLGEGLVSGAVDADSFVLDRSGRVLHTVLGAKETAHRLDPDAGVVVGEVERAARIRPALDAGQAAAVGRLADAVADRFGTAQDIEWAIDEDRVWLLQARPVTAAVTDTGAALRLAAAATIRGAGEDVPAGEQRIWDNSNIIESFSGITSPLTYTTAADIYGRVYRGYAASLRVPAAQLAQTDAWTPVLLGSFHGRVYYNLLHWYRMVGIAPGYPLNRKVLEAALGVAEPLPAEIARTLRPFTFDRAGARLRSRAVTTAGYLHRLVRIDAMVEQFLTEFYRVYDEFEAIEHDSLTGAQAYAEYRRIDADLVDRWGPLMVLDAILLTLTGTMYALTKAFLPKAPEWFFYAVIGPGADVESAEPARAMAELARLARTDPALVELINTTEPGSVHERVQQSGSPEFRSAVESYLRRYGYRSLDELKLEVPDLHEDPANLYLLLRSALGRTGAAARPAGEPDRAGDAEAYLDAHLRGLRRRIYDRLRAKLSRCAAHRERLRFCRTRAFGMVKRLIRVMGRDLVARGVIDEFDDVFQLTVQELRGCYAGADTDRLRARIAERRRQHATDLSLAAPARFVTTGGAFGRAELAGQGWVARTDLPPARAGTVLSGTPSATGVVEGPAVVADEPRDVAGGVLIAYRTDPGWVAALPSASALVIERGSPLTHVAIVARELGVPTVVQIDGATARLRTGMRVRVDGAAGTVTVVSVEGAA